MKNIGCLNNTGLKFVTTQTCDISSASHSQTKEGVPLGSIAQPYYWDSYGNFAIRSHFVTKKRMGEHGVPGQSAQWVVLIEIEPGPNFIELLSTQICLALNFFLDKNRITNQMFICCILRVTGIQLLLAYPYPNLWLVILFLSRKKF